MLGSTYGWVRRTGVCSECGEPLEKGDRQVKSKFRSEDGKLFSFRAHAECWVERLWQYFRDNPYEANRRGKVPGSGRKKKLDLTPEQQKKRVSLMQRRRNEIKRMSSFRRLGMNKAASACLEKIEKLNDELEEYGGAVHARQT